MEKGKSSPLHINWHFWLAWIIILAIGGAAVAVVRWQQSSRPWPNTEAMLDYLFAHGSGEAPPASIHLPLGPVSIHFPPASKPSRSAATPDQQDAPSPLPAESPPAQSSPQPVPACADPGLPSGSGIIWDIPTGQETYRIGSNDWPNFLEAVMDPIDPAICSSQRLTVKIRDNNPIGAVWVILKTDRGSQRHDLALISGSATEGYWQGEWLMGDTYLYRYAFDLGAESQSGQAKVEIVLR